MVMIKSPTFVFVLVVVVVSILSVVSIDAFQFMKDWKLPTYDPNEEAVKDKFGDKSKM
jgi:hypothetical protein